MSQLLGIDLGTSSVKCALIDADTLIINGVASCDTQLFYPETGYVEQSTDDWWQATTEVVRALSAQYRTDDLIGIGFSGQMHGTVLLDHHGDVLHPAIIWADQRTASVLSQFDAIPDFVATTGTRISAGFMGATLVWLRDNRPDLLEKTAKVLLPKDYLCYRLTGVLGTEVSDAASTGLFDIHAQDWAWEIIDALQLPRNIFPDVRQSYDPVGDLRSDVAEAFGLPRDIAVVAGAADQPAQAIGNGILTEGRMSITLGSGGQIFLPINEAGSFEADDRIHLFNHATGGWYALGAILSAGLSLRWLRDVLADNGKSEAYDVLEEKATQIPAGSEGLIFLPYLNGTRTPHMNPLARGAFIGLTSRHTQAHMIRATMEGVAYAIKQAYDVCRFVAPHPASQIIGAGGGMQSVLWRQIIADVIAHPIHTTTQTEQAVIGAGVLAGIGIHHYGDTVTDNLTAVSQLVDHTGDVIEVSDNQQVYQDCYDVFTEIYPLLNSSG